MSILDLRPGRCDIIYRPGNDYTIEVTWPAGQTDGRAYTAFLGRRELDVDVAGDVVTITAAAAITATMPQPRSWTLLQDGDVVITGQASPSTDGSGSPSAETTVVVGTVEVTVVAPSIDLQGFVPIIGMLGTTLGASSLDGNGDIVLDVRTRWGIDSNGDPYYSTDPDDIPADEQAILLPDLGGGLNFLLVSDLALRELAFPLLDANNLDDLADVAVARANLGLAAPIRSVLADPFPSTSDVTPSDVMSVPVAASTEYWVKVLIFYDAATAGDIRVLFTKPAGTTFLFGYHALDTSATSAAGAKNLGALTDASGDLLAGGIGTGVKTWLLIEGRMVVGATAGNFGLQAAQGTSSLTATVVQPGTTIELQELL